MNNFEKYKFIKEKLNAPRFDNEDEEIDWFTKHLYGLYNQASRLREENNNYMSRIDKQKEVLDKIKDIIKDRAYWCDETEDGDIVSGKLLQDDEITEIEELLEDLDE